MRTMIFVILLFTFTSVWAAEEEDVLPSFYGFELDALPYITGGHYFSGWYGEQGIRGRIVVASVNVPEFLVDDSFTNNSIDAFAVLIDYFPERRFSGLWFGAGFEYWKGSIEEKNTHDTALYKHYIATAGAGYVLDLGSGFYVNPWAAAHFTLIGDREVKLGGLIYDTPLFTPEVSIKIGWKRETW